LVWIGLDPNPNGGGAGYVNGDNYAPASGQLALLNFLETAPGDFDAGAPLPAVEYDEDDGGHIVGGGFWLTNGGCASYFAHVEVHFEPLDASGTSAAVDGGSPVEAQAEASALSTLVDAGGDAVVGAAAPVDAAADGSDGAPLDAAADGSD